MTALPLVPQEIVARLRARLSTAGIDARPVYVVPVGQDEGQVEFVTNGGALWPLVLRVGGDGRVHAMHEGGAEEAAAPAASLAEVLDRLHDLFSGLTPRPATEPGAA